MEIDNKKQYENINDDNMSIDENKSEIDEETNRKTNDEMIELSDDFNKINIFSDQDEYMRLHNMSMIDIEKLNESELLEIIDDTYNRYKYYLKVIEFVDEAVYIKKYIKKYIRLYNMEDIEDLEDKELFNMMKMIDMNMLDIIHDNDEPIFWFNKN
jgi:hypothetical protein